MMLSPSVINEPISHFRNHEGPSSISARMPVRILFLVVTVPTLRTLSL